MEPQRIESEGQQDNIELEAPEQLSLGQDFYNQPPFNTIFPDIAALSGLPEGHLKTLITSLKTDPKFFDVDRIQAWEKNPMYGNGLEFKTEFFRRSKSGGEMNRAEYARYQQAMLQLAKKFAEYPFLGEYMNSQFERGLFKYDGSWNVINDGKYVQESLPQTYAKWAADQINLFVGKGQIAGIDKISPKPIAYPDFENANNEERPQLYKWSIPRADAVNLQSKP